MPSRKKDAITGKPRPDWIAIKAMYLAGTKFCDLAKEFKVPEGTIKSRAYRFKWLGGEMSPRVIKIEKIVGASTVAHISRSCLDDSARDIECPRRKCLPNPLGGLRRHRPTRDLRERPHLSAVVGESVLWEHLVERLHEELVAVKVCKRSQ